MPSPISISSLAAVGYAALALHARASSAVSETAQAGELAAEELAESVEHSHALFGERAATISKLRQLAIDYSQPNWDGEGAEPIDMMAVITAESFIQALPESLQMPELAPEPDGQISLDWVHSKGRVFSMSVGKSGRLSYAWIDGADQGHAVARFDYRAIPHRVLEGITSIVGYASIGLA